MSTESSLLHHEQRKVTHAKQPFSVIGNESNLSLSRVEKTTLLFLGERFLPFLLAKEKAIVLSHEGRKIYLGK